MVTMHGKNKLNAYSGAVSIPLFRFFPVFLVLLQNLDKDEKVLSH